MRLNLIIKVMAVALMAGPAISVNAQEPPCPIGGYPAISCPIRTDGVIKSVVSSRIGRSTDSPWEQIDVAVNDGAVILTGQVGSYERWQVATILATSVRGVTSVCNQMTICAQADTDLGIMRAIRSALGKMPYVTRGVNVNVTRGVVNLYGTAATDYVRSQAEIIAASVQGVSMVNNDLIVHDVGGTF